MKTIILIIMACVLGFFAYQYVGSSNSSTIISEDGNDLVIENGDNTYVAEVVSDFNEELRIYGINDNDSKGWTPIGYARYILVAGPWTGDTEECERRDAAKASYMNIIVDDNSLLDTFEDLKSVEGRRTATLIGEKVIIKEYYHNDEDHSDSLAKQGKLEPNNAVIVSEIYLNE